MTDRPENRDPREVRASDSDRDRTAEVLRDAAGEGRLSMEELDERLDAVYAAKTYAELEPIVHDLPAVPTEAGPVARTGGPAGSARDSGSVVAVMSGFERKGAWVVPGRLTAVAVMGGGQLDLRTARLPGPEVTIRVVTVMGGVEVIVPEDADVHVDGVGIMGGFDNRATGPGRPGAPRIIVTGVAFWGGVSVRRKAPKGKAERDR
jgi:hypothetical protein